MIDSLVEFVEREDFLAEPDVEILVPPDGERVPIGD